MQVLHNTAYDLILVDIHLTGLDGFGFIRKLNKNFNTTPVIVISADKSLDLIQEATRQGAMGYIHKSLQAKEIMSIVHSVLSGNIYFPLEVEKPDWISDNNLSAFGLSERQIEVLRLMENGLSNKEIANQLGITESTVKSHTSKLMACLAAKNRTSCVIEGKRLGLI